MWFLKIFIKTEAAVNFFSKALYCVVFFSESNIIQWSKLNISEKKLCFLDLFQSYFRVSQYRWVGNLLLP